MKDNEYQQQAIKEAIIYILASYSSELIRLGYSRVFRKLPRGGVNIWKTSKAGWSTFGKSRR